MTVLIDSWAWIEYWKGGRHKEQAAAYIDGDEEAVISTINLAEVYFWILRFYDEATANDKVSTIEKRCHAVVLERDIAIEAAKIKKSEKLGLADSLILSTARQVGGKVVTGDPDMQGIRDVIFLSSSQA